MADSGEIDGMRIGSVLKAERARQGLEMRDVEERTKIRVRYLRAIEAEDWDTLPAPAYAKGFLHTYAQLLGLDADAIVDEFVRQVAGELEPGSPLRPIGEPVLEGRRRLEAPPRRFGPLALIGFGALAAVGIVLLIGLIGDEDGDDGGPAARENPKRQRANKGDAKDGPAVPSGSSVDLSLEVKDAVEVCLLGADEEVLIAGQVLSAGTSDSFTQPRFQLRFPTGFDPDQFMLSLDGEKAHLNGGKGPVGFSIAPGAAPRALPDPGEGCP